MAKRKGVNYRKQTIQRKKKVAGSLRKHGPVVVIVLAGIIVIFCIVKSGILSGNTLQAAAQKSGFFSVRSIVVKGNRRIAENDIVKQCGLIAGDALFGIQKETVVAACAAHPWVEEAKCIKRLWGRVVIEIRERIPVAMVNCGEVMLVDRKGILLPVSTGTRYELPLVNGLEVHRRKGQRYIDSADMARLNEFIGAINQNDPQFFQVIPQFDMRRDDRVEGFAVSPQTIVGMDYRIDEEQLKNIRYMLNTLVTRDTIPEHVNVQYQNLAFVTMKRKN